MTTTTTTPIPDDPTSLDDDELTALLNETVVLFDAGSPDVPKLETLADHVTTVRAEADSRGLTNRSTLPDPVLRTDIGGSKVDDAEQITGRV